MVKFEEGMMAHVFWGLKIISRCKAMLITMASTSMGKRGKDTPYPIAAQQEEGDRENLRAY